MTARGACTAALATLLVSAIALGPAVSAGREARGTSNLAEVRGPVLRVTATPGEGGLDVVAVEIDGGEGPAQMVLLGPASMLDEAGFEVSEGDLLRVKVFVGESEGDARAALRVLNLTRRTMVRLRTFHQDPLWDTSGRWEGVGAHGARGTGRPPSTGPARGRREGAGSRGGR